jgi:hypothetical protein
MRSFSEFLNQVELDENMGMPGQEDYSQMNQQQLIMALKRADMYLHQADRDRDNAVTNFKAQLTPTLRRLFVDMAKLDPNNCQTETEFILVDRMIQIIKTLKNAGFNLGF